MRALAAAFALICATPLAAQDRMTQALCDGSLSELAGVSDVTGQVRADAGGWCVVDNATVRIDARTRLGLDQLRWRASGLARFLDDGLPPRSVEMTARGIRTLPQTGDDVYDYLLGLQMRSVAGVGFEIGVRWDELQNAVIIDKAMLEFDTKNRIEVTGRIDGVNLTDMASIQTSLGSAGLRQLLVKAQFDGWFESYVAVPVGATLLIDNSVPPAQQVATLKEQAIAFIGDLPADLIPSPTRAALVAFVSSLPQPRGTAQLQVSAEPALSAARLMPLILQGTSVPLSDLLGTSLDGATLRFIWTPTKDTP